MESGRALLKGAAASNIYTMGAAASNAITIGAAPTWPVMFFAGRAAHHGTSLPPLRPHKLSIRWPHYFRLPKKDK